MDTATQKGFRLDVNKCTGCQACQVACSIENQLAPGTSWRWIDTYNEARQPDVPQFHLSLACNHCVDPPCQEHCPALAYTKDPDTGVVKVDESKCIGCKYCLWACPYDAPRFDADSGVVHKCTYCDHRLAEGGGPACVAQCPTGALEAIDLNGEEHEEHQDHEVRGFPRTEAAPSIRFVPLRGEQPYPEAMALTSGLSLPAAPGTRVASKVALRSEWPLAVFSLLIAALVGWFTAGVLVGTGPGTASALVFLLVAALAAGASTLHLGRKLRAYRAVLNWRRSWLSREILFFSGFVALGLIHLALEPPGPLIAWLAVGLGCATLYAVDQVYAVTATRDLGRHSARALFTGALALVIALGGVHLVVPVAGLKLGLYVYRKHLRARSGEDLRLPWALLRVGGLLMAVALGLTGVSGLGWIALGCVVLGEIVDRCEFYLELEISTPRRQMALDLAEDLART